MKKRYFRILSWKLVSLALLGLFLNTQLGYAQDDESEEDCPGPGCPAIRTTGNAGAVWGGIVGGIIGGAILQESYKNSGQIRVRPSTDFTNTGIPQVRVIQIMLSAIGFNPGRIDGLSGPKTKEAIKKFQKLIGDDASGTLSGEQAGRLLGTFFEQSQDTDILLLTDTRTGNNSGELDEGTAINLTCIPEGLEFRCRVSTTVPVTQRSVSP